MDSKNTTYTRDRKLLLEEQRQTFVASLGHDLKNPTIAQIRTLELLLKGAFGKIEPAQKDILEMVLDSCKYMYAMLGSLLLTYKNDNGIVKLANEDVHISELAKECVDEMIYLAKDKNIKISICNICNNDTICGDRIQLKRVIINLLSNGIKYAYPASNLIIKIYNEKNNTCFSFTNSSPFIPEEKRNLIFERYVSYSKTFSTNGIGLGLYASKKIIEAHNGIIFVKSYKNNRNTFGFKIPNDINYQDERYVIF